MRGELLPQAARYRKKHRRRRLWQRIVSVLACVVVFCTTYALILPAVTMEETAFCGLEEHHHNESCVEKRLICGFPDTVETTEAPTTDGHIHSEECYSEQTVTVCAVEESPGHIHGGDCTQTTQTLNCEEEHEHTVDCYLTVEEIICGIAEGEGTHTHAPECCSTTRSLTCGFPDDAQTVPETTEPHVHTEECYEITLICPLEEHAHTLACYSDPEADLESAAVWERSFSGVELTGIWAEDLVAIAETQLGYQESTKNYQVMEDGVTIKGITRYGRWYGAPYGDWCAMFVSFCLHYAEIPDTAVPYDEGCPHWVAVLSRPEWALYHESKDYTPQKGDIVFFDNNGDDCADHVGLVRKVEEDTLTVIEGNSGNSVRSREYPLDDPCLIGYAALPENPNPPTPDTEPATAETTEPVTEEPLFPALAATVYTDDTCQTPMEDGTSITASVTPTEGAALYAYPATVPETDFPLFCGYYIGLQLPEDTELTPEPALIRIQSPALLGQEACQVYALWENGDWMPIDTQFADGTASFTANLNSLYLLGGLREADIPEEPVSIPLSGDYTFQNDQFTITFHIEGTALPLPGEAAVISDPDEAPSDNTLVSPNAAQPTEGAAEDEEPPMLMVTQLSPEQTAYAQALSALESTDARELLELSVLALEFYWQGTPLDVSQCQVTAQITPRAQTMTSAQEAYAQLEADAAPEAETGIVFTAVEATPAGTSELDSAMVNTASWEAPVLTARVNPDGVLAIAASTTANPTFTVQYYAWLDVAAESGTGNSNDVLPVIDTSGGKLPQNGVNPTVKNLYLVETGSSGVYRINTVSTLTQVYRTHDYQYITAPNLTYFNRLYENGHYRIKEIWILENGKNPDSTNAADWDVYPSTTHFTNRSQSVNATTVLISDGAVIRLVFDTTDSVYTNAVAFYDYDITDDGTHTASHGINSPANYSGSGTKLAFGNDNTDTGLSQITWNGNTLNMANKNGYSGCTFGLVTGLSGDQIQYASGVDAPKLFNDGSARGKTSYDSGQYSLSFQRVGDTYTLSSVGGTTSAGNLQTFTSRLNWNQTRKIWSNHFWPMDNVTNTDPHTGKTGSPGSYIGSTGKTNNYPESDNDLAHNNMFGMTYQVQFTLNEDYIGPLEYYFFGDDDMWVFLDGRLVCDIGGVHSSVGEYVDLWDYVQKGSSGTHTLSFFYTERGLSGSTCYMQFTLPSVSSITPEQNTALLTVQKQVEGAVAGDEEFHFEIKFTDASGNPLPDDYSYTRYTAEGILVKQDVIIYDGGSFDLKAGEYVVINYLPYGTRYTITETDAPYYTVTHTIDGGTPVEGRTVEGSIPSGNATVVFTNTAMPVLPSTGGTGTQPYTIGGTFLILGALLLLYKRKKGRKEDAASS